jgi:hypothetical protein
VAVLGEDVCLACCLISNEKTCSKTKLIFPTWQDCLLEWIAEHWLGGSSGEACSSMGFAQWISWVFEVAGFALVHALLESAEVA